MEEYYRGKKHIIVKRSTVLDSTGMPNADLPSLHKDDTNRISVNKSMAGNKAWISRTNTSQSMAKAHRKVKFDRF